MHSIGGLKLYVMNVMDVISSFWGLKILCNECNGCNQP